MTRQQAAALLLDLPYVLKLKKRLDGGTLPVALEARVLGFLVDLPAKPDAPTLPAWLQAGDA